jgi:hypothetical protein
MVEAGVIDISSLEPHLINNLQRSDPATSVQEEYEQIEQICNDLIQDMKDNKIIRIRSIKDPIFRSYEAISDELESPEATKNPEFLTEYIKTTTKKEFINPDNENVIFILLHKSVFPEGYSISQIKIMLDHWSSKVNKGLQAFGKELTSTPPEVTIQVYEHLEEIGHNPLEHYNRSHLEYNRYGKPHIPAIMIDCSPLENQNQYEYHYGRGFPDFSLCYSLIGDNENTDEHMQKLTNKFGNGLIIFQREVDCTGIVSNILKLSSVLSARYLIGEKVTTREINLVESLFNKSFIESRKFSDTKSGGVMFNHAYRDTSVIAESGIKKFASDWNQYNGHAMKDAIMQFDRHLHNCTYSDGDRLRLEADGKLDLWKKLAYLVAEQTCDSCNDTCRSHNLGYNHEYGGRDWEKVQINNENIEILTEKCRSLSSAQYSHMCNKFHEEYYRVLNLPRTNFPEFFKRFSKLIISLKQVYYSTNPLHHPPREESLPVLSEWGVFFFLSTRMRVYGPLRTFLGCLGEELRTLENTEPHIRKSLMEFFNLEPVTRFALSGDLS